MKMTKKKAAVFGLAATTLFSVGGFSGCVYGPPPEYDPGNNNNIQIEDDGNSLSGDVISPQTTIGVDDNEPAAVYGPPQALEEYENQEGEATDAPEVTDAPTPTVNVEDNEMPDVYGPPEDF
ncbi:MAG: hypothetical protein V3G41_04800 [Lachnospiraceae bacterium]